MRAIDIEPGQSIVMAGKEFTVTKIKRRVVIGYEDAKGNYRTMSVDGDKEFATPEQGALL